MKRLLATSAALVGLVACAGTSEPPQSPPPTPPLACNVLTDQARSQVTEAISSHLSCSSDSDCVLTGLSASCFDACSRTVSASSGGPDAVKAAVARVDADQCRRFNEEGCHFDVPPCGPPRQPRCSAGSCTM